MPERPWSYECPCGRAHGEPHKSRVRSCLACGRTHSAADVIAVGKFDPAGVHGYRTADGEVHATREAAQSWLCDQRTSVLPPAERGQADA